MTKDEESKFLYSDKIFLLSFLPILLINPHTHLWSYLGHNVLIYFLSMISFFLVISFLYKQKLGNPINNTLFSVLIIHILIYASSSILLRDNFKQGLFYIFFAFILLRLLTCNIQSIEFFLKKYFYLITTILLINVLVFFYFKSSMELLQLETVPQQQRFLNTYLNGVLSNRYYGLLGVFINYDAGMTGYLLDPRGVSPRMTGHFISGSLINAYFVFILGLLLLIGMKSKIIILLSFIICLITASATTHLTILLSLFILIFFKFLKKIGPFPIIGSTILFLIILYFIIDDSKGTAESHFFVEWARENNIKWLRLSSGISRLVIIKSQISMFLDNFYTGFGLEGSTLSIREFKSTNINHYSLGSFLMTSGVRSGVLGFIVSLILYYLIIINLIKIKTQNNYEKLGVSILLSATIIFFTVTDYGFSNYSGILLMGMLFKVFIYKNTNDLQLKKAIQDV